MLEESRRQKLKQVAKCLYNLELGESVFFNDNSSWLRVPGGWVYRNQQGTIFIPYHKEFITNYLR